MRMNRFIYLIISRLFVLYTYMYKHGVSCVFPRMARVSGYMFSRACRSPLTSCMFFRVGAPTAHVFTITQLVQLCSFQYLDRRDTNFVSAFRLQLSLQNCCYGNPCKCTLLFNWHPIIMNRSKYLLILRGKK